MSHKLTPRAATPLILALVAACSLASRSHAAEAIVGDTAAGHAYAQKNCAQCHSIEAGATTSLVIDATPFALLVKHKKLTSSAIEGWLRASHSQMRATTMSPQTRADLVAYIKSLALK